MSLRLRMILLAGACILPSFLLLAITQWQLRQAEAGEVRRANAELARTEASVVGTIIGGTHLFLSALEHIPPVTERNAPLCSAWLARLRAANPGYASIRADDLMGRTFCSSDPGRAGFDGSRAYFRAAIQSHGFAVGSEGISPITHRLELPLARVVSNDDGDPADVLVVGLDLSWLSHELGARLPPDASVILLDRDGHEVLHAFGAAVSPRDRKVDPTGNPAGWMVDRAMVGDGSYGLTVITAQPRNVAFAALDRATVEGVALAGLALLLACLVAGWIGRSFIQAPIQTLLATTERLRRGDYTARTQPAAGASELAQLGRGLNALAHELERRSQAQADAEAGLRHAAATLEQRVEERTRALATANRQLAEEAERRHRTQAELAQVQKLDAIGKLTGGIAHDFNNLLAAILGSLEMVLPRVQDARQQRLLTVASQAAQRGAKLTAHLLAFSRKQELTLRPVDMNAVISGMGDLLSRTLGKLVRLDFDLADDLWMATGDHVQLEVALLNLAINARDAMPDGGTLSFRTRNMHVAEGPHAGVTLAPGDYAMVAVIDSGEGMSPEVQSKVFEPFFTTKGPGKGTGLGLSMVYGFARQAAGTVTIDSTPGKGSAISLYLPRAEGPAETVRPPTVESDAAAQPLRVLLVDDDAMVRETTQEMLCTFGHSVVAAATPEAALRLLREGPRFDLLVADFAMPGMTGVQLATEVRRMYPSLPVLIITGYADADALHAAPARFWPVLKKPFVSAELADAVRTSTEAAGDRA